MNRATLGMLAALLLLPLSLDPLSAQQAGSDLPSDGSPYVYINSRVLLQNAPGAVEAQEAWQQELTRYRTELQQLQADVDSLQAAFEQQREMLSPEARERKQQEIRQKQQELQARASELEQQAARRQQELLNPILSDVESVIEEIRAEHGYGIVFDVANAGVMAADPSLDITEQVVKELQARAAAGDTVTGGGSSPSASTGSGSGGGVRF